MHCLWSSPGSRCPEQSPSLDGSACSAPTGSARRVLKVESRGRESTLWCVVRGAWCVVRVLRLTARPMPPWTSNVCPVNIRRRARPAEGCRLRKAPGELSSPQLDVGWSIGYGAPAPTATAAAKNWSTRPLSGPYSVTPQADFVASRAIRHSRNGPAPQDGHRSGQWRSPGLAADSPCCWVAD